MLGPRIVGNNEVSLEPGTAADFRIFDRLQQEPEVRRFWGPRFGDYGDAAAEARFLRNARNADGVTWSIHYRSEAVGFTGIFHIDWVSRDAETGMFIGRADLYGRGIAGEVVRLRTEFARRDLRLRRLHNWIALPNRGSRRANEKAGYREMGRFEGAWVRSGEAVAEWLGEILLEPVDKPLSAP